MKQKLNLKSVVTGVIIGGLLTSGIGYAASHLTSIEVSMNPVHFKYNGKQLELEEGKSSFIYEDTTYVPLRWLSESLGKQVEWDEVNRIISIVDLEKEEQDVSEQGKVDDGEVTGEQDVENTQNAGLATVEAELTLDKEVYTPTDSLQFTIANHASGTLSFGRPFSIEYLQDEQWVEYPVELMFTMELIILMGNDTFTQTVDLSQLDLQEGTYKLIKHVYDEDSSTVAEIFATFEVIRSHS